MRFIEKPDEGSVAEAAVAEIALGLAARRNPVLVAASGGSPVATFGALATRYRAEPHLFADLRIVKLDEWAGLPSDDPATCETFVRGHLVRPLEVSEDRYLGFDGMAAEPAAECARVAAAFADWGPADACVLGIGLNGHLGFNEPADELCPHAHVAALSETSLEHSMLSGAASKPQVGLTLGMADILSARKLIVIVTGAHKRAALARLKCPLISAQFPGSFLWLRPDAICFHDAAAAGHC